MAENPRNMLRYRVLRYAPLIGRDEWMNIGILLDWNTREGHALPRPAMRVIEQQSEFARVRRLHPETDESVLRGLLADFEAGLQTPAAESAAFVANLVGRLSNALQLSEPKGVLAEDFEAELNRLYHAFVAPPPRSRPGPVESTRAWIIGKLNDVFRRRRVPRLQRNVRVEEFTEVGDSFKLDYGYRNGVRGFLHAVALGRDPAQPKILAYAARRIRQRIPDCEFTAITEVEPSEGNRRHEFVMRLFAEENIALVSLPKIEKFAEDLRLRLQ